MQEGKEMLKEIIKENLVSELGELARRSKAEYKNTNSHYHQGKFEAYEVALGMVEKEVK